LIKKVDIRSSLRKGYIPRGIRTAGMPGIRKDQQRGMINGAQQEMTVGSGAGIAYPLPVAASFFFLP